jgi:hypothetical protein
MELPNYLMIKSYIGQVHTNPGANGDGNDLEGLHVCYPCEDIEILGWLIKSWFFTFKFFFAHGYA